jgi:hypothetical protein
VYTRILNAITLLAACAMSTGASTVFAHEGHGPTAAHVHATDVWGFVVVGCLTAAAIWFARKGK